MLANTAYADFEVLLVADEGSPADVLDWLAAMGRLGSEQLRIVQVEARGQAASLNEASLQARGEYLLLLDSRCVLFDSQWP